MTRNRMTPIFPTSGSLPLSSAPERLEVRCRKCDRYGVYNRDKLIADLGDIKLPDLASKLGDCPGRAANDLCFVYFPHLSAAPE